MIQSIDTGFLNAEFNEFRVQVQVNKWLTIYTHINFEHNLCTQLGIYKMQRLDKCRVFVEYSTSRTDYNLPNLIDLSRRILHAI